MSIRSIHPNTQVFRYSHHSQTLTHSDASAQIHPPTRSDPLMLSSACWLGESFKAALLKYAPQDIAILKSGHHARPHKDSST